ncbi:2Fe-2S iron-sulfur cluster-binding protein [Zavarzinia sp.]|uniref:2Fe-2S iron-sulfur cluster-binding protein n=1 Tax=Zavarzinia sp. TaxID=2027920 RepID=UPI003563DCF6
MTDTFTFTIDGVQVEAEPGQTVIEACDAAGVYIPRLCHHPELPPVGQCRLCTCKIDGRMLGACVTPAARGMVVESDTEALNEDRRRLVEMYFVEGNHFCPTCEKSGDCELQALGYRLGMVGPQLSHLWPKREIDARHPDIYIDHNRCILCSRCIRASKLLDGKSVFGFEGRGIEMRLAVMAETLDETALAAADRAVSVCPVGCIVVKRRGYHVPYGKRHFDETPIGADIEARRKG